MIRLEGEQDTRQSRIEYVREQFPELVKAFEAEYEQVIVPPAAGTAGDILPLVGLVSKIAPLLPNTKFHILCVEDYKDALRGVELSDNIELHYIDQESPLSLKKRLAEVSTKGEIGIERIMDTYSKPMENVAERDTKTEQKPQGFLHHIRDRVQAWYDTNVPNGYDRTLFLGSMTSFAYYPKGADTQTVTPYIPYVVGEELLSELVFTIWKEKWYSGIQAFLTRKYILDAVLGMAKVEDATDIHELNQRSFKPLFTMAENMIPATTPSGKPTRIERLSIGAVSPADADQEKTEQTLQLIDELQKAGHKVALLSTSASSLNGNYEYIGVIAKSLQERSKSGEQWKLLIPGEYSTALSEWAKESGFENGIVQVKHTHHPAVLPQIDLLFASAGVGTATEALKAAVPTVLFAMPNGTEQMKQANKAAAQSQSVKSYGWFTNLLKDEGQLGMVIEQVTQANREEALKIAEAMQQEEELLSDEVKLGLILFNIFASE